MCAQIIAAICNELMQPIAVQIEMRLPSVTSIESVDAYTAKGTHNQRLTSDMIKLKFEVEYSAV